MSWLDNVNSFQGKINSLTNYTEQSTSREAKRSTASQQVPKHLMEPKNSWLHSKVPVPMLSQSNPVHVSFSHFFKIHFIIILPSTPTSSMTSPHQNLVCTSPVSHLCHMPFMSYFSWFEHLNNIWWGVLSTKLLITVFFSTPQLPHPSLALFSNTLSLFLPQCERSSLTPI